jgi:hypothetical protein
MVKMAESARKLLEEAQKTNSSEEYLKRPNEAYVVFQTHETSQFEVRAVNQTLSVGEISEKLGIRGNWFKCSAHTANPQAAIQEALLAGYKFKEVKSPDLANSEISTPQIKRSKSLV